MSTSGAAQQPEQERVWRAVIARRRPPATGAGAELVERYGPLAASAPPVTIAQLGQSLDGFIASRTGDARFVTGDADREHLHRLRALVDAVVVGAATVLADDPQLTVRAVAGPDPVRVVLDPRGRLPGHVRVLTDGAAPTLWLRPSPAPQVAGHVEVEVLPVGPGGFAPGEVLARLHARGLTRVLVEGGGRVVSAFVAAGLVDRLYLTTAPMLIGDGVPGLRFDGQDALAGALTGPSRRFLLGDDVCTELVLRPGAPEADQQE